MTEYPIDLPHEEPERERQARQERREQAEAVESWDKVFRVIGCLMADTPLVLAFLVVFGLTIEFLGFLLLLALTNIIKMAIRRF